MTESEQTELLHLLAAAVVRLAERDDGLLPPETSERLRLAWASASSAGSGQREPRGGTSVDQVQAEVGGDRDGLKVRVTATHVEANPPGPAAAEPPFLEQVIVNLNAVLHPSLKAVGPAMRWLIVLALAVLLLTPVFLCSPFAPEGWQHGLAAGALVQLHVSKEGLKHVCDWVALVAQVLIVLFIGGAAFTEAFARRVADVAGAVTQAAFRGQEYTTDLERQQIESAWNNLRGLGQVKGQFNKLRVAMGALRTLQRDANSLPQRFIRVGVIGMISSFPGGLYGLFGFICLFGQVVAICCKILLDYALS